MATRGPARQRLMREHERGVEELVDGVDPDDTAMMEQRLDRVVVGRHRRGVRARRLATGRGPAALDRDDRLDPSDATSQTRANFVGLPNDSR